ncbi:Xaa-Pro aminopeptidase [Sphingobacterium faecium NBRC 15299]|uniref:aminopeptidase P family protein n=1 Tax=Sphingobacterium faecium TaxID=34087 RepID=UPI000D39F857|nr:aminopeptidase P family protein [Sphingobacterium faecium]PTX11655.1 Xaa-Pro aminopeptidase [Sphingobacterium faecium]GEM64478.1 Xaa-Pro aminopeptidase [Sphingobacterium faecium NBRC 15299]
MFEKDIYIKRRNELSSKFSSGLLLLLGNIENPINFEHNTYPFRQDSSFLYYIGIKSPKLAAVVDIQTGETLLFGDEMTIDDIVWMGQQQTLNEKAQWVGIASVHPFHELQPYLEKVFKNNNQVHYLPPYQAHNKLLLQHLLGISIDQIKPSVEMIKAVVTQRNIKAVEEIAELEKAVDVAVDMHRLAIKMTRPGMHEYEISNAIQHLAQNRQMSFSYPPIVTKHGEILHNHIQYHKIKAGDILLNDSGVETALGYASDLTRSFPVGKRFNPLQEELYAVVLNAFKTAEAALKPGVAFKNIHLKACEALAEGLIQIGFMKGNAQDAVAAHAHALFFQCGLGHMLGLDVHDMEDLGEQYVGYTADEPKDTKTFGIKSLRLGKKLEAGNVVTVEPGIYIIPELTQMWAQQNLHHEFINYDLLNKHLDFGGIRIEDNYVIQDSGYHRLGKYLEREIDEIYALKDLGTD